MAENVMRLERDRMLGTVQANNLDLPERGVALYADVRASASLPLPQAEQYLSGTPHALFDTGLKSRGSC